MKNLSILSVILLIIWGCSDEDTSSSTPALQNLHYTEKFVPTLAGYEAGVEGSYKNVKHYQDNLVISDSTYNSNGDVIKYVVITYSGSVKTEEYFGIDVVHVFKTYIYDDLGRVVTIAGDLTAPAPPLGAIIFDYSYNGDGTIVKTAIDTSTNLPIANYEIIYSTNASGLIDQIDFNNQATSTILYNGQKPIQFFHHNGESVIETIDFTYYTNEIPINLQKSIAQINNSLFEDFESRIADNCNYNLMSYGNLVTFEKSFNSENYVTYSKAVGEMHEEQYDSETFYYYE